MVIQTALKLGQSRLLNPHPLNRAQIRPLELDFAQRNFELVCLTSSLNEQVLHELGVVFEVEVFVLGFYFRERGREVIHLPERLQHTYILLDDLLEELL